MSSRQPPGGWRAWYLGWQADDERRAVEPSPEKDWYTVKEAAQLFQVHPKTVYKWVREGEIKADRPSPRTTRIHKRDLLAYLRRDGS
jgi:excisionase family DNA binding protein